MTNRDDGKSKCNTQKKAADGNHQLLFTNLIHGQALTDLLWNFQRQEL